MCGPKRERKKFKKILFLSYYYYKYLIAKLIINKKNYN